MRSLWIIPLMSSLLLLSTGPMDPAWPAPTQPILHTGRVLVRFKPGVRPHDKAAHHARHGARVLKEIPEFNLHLVEIPDPATTQQVAAAYAGSPAVQYAEPDALMPMAGTTGVIPTDPLFPYQWHHPAIHTPEAWAITTGLPTTRITICDSGISPTHPDLQASLRGDLGYNTASNLPGNWEPVFWHGTAVAGAVAAVGNNALGVTGVTWATEIVPVRITNRFDAWAYVSDMAACLIYGADIGSDVINLSYVTYADGAIFSAIISAADYANSLGTVVVIAAGNDSTNPAPTHDPDSILYVAATNPDNTTASFSNYGAYVDLAAPGASIVTTHSQVACTDTNGNGIADPGECAVTSDDYASGIWGTSFAAPMTAGAVLLLRSVAPSFPPASIRSLLCQSAVDLGPTGEDQLYGCGLLNVQAALQLAQGSIPALRVAAPNGGETWPIGTTQTITWTSTALSGNVNIDLSRDGGTTWTTVATDIPNTGQYNWTVTGPATSRARIRLRSAAMPSVSDASDADFTIVDSLKVVTPNGGEVWSIGSKRIIRWATGNVSGDVRIDLSRDGGGTWTSLTSRTANYGRWEWKVTGPASTSALVRITSLKTPTIADKSDAAFTIGP